MRTAAYCGLGVAQGFGEVSRDIHGGPLIRERQNRRYYREQPVQTEGPVF